MANQQISTEPFSIANFKKVFSNSASRQCMSDMDVEQVRTAIEEKDVVLLGKLYEILLKEQVADDEIIRDFVMTKNKILDGFMFEARNIENKFVQAPMKKRAAKTAKREQKNAEKMLEDL